MNSAKRSVSCAAFLGLMLMLSATANAEYETLSGYSSGANSSSINTDVLKPAGLAASGNVSAGEAALEASLKASIEKGADVIERSKEERELRKKVEGAKGQIKDKQGAILGIKQKQDEAVKNIIKKNEADLARINGIASAPGGTGADLNTNQMEASCRSGVDFSQAKSLADTMGSQPVQYLKDEATRLTEETNKEAKAKRAAGIAKLFESLEKFQEDNKKAEGFATQIQQRTDLKKDNSLNASLNALKTEWDDQKNRQLPDIDNQLKKTIKDVVLGAVAIDDNANDADFVKLKSFFADSMRAHVKGVKTSFRQGSDQLLANCEKNVDQIGRGNVLGGSSWSNSAYRFAAKISPRFANETLMPLLTNMTNSEATQCTDVSQGVESLFGAPMDQAIEIVRSSRDRKSLINNAFALTTTIGNAQAQIGSVMRPLMDDCDAVSKNLKKVKELVTSVKGQSEQLAQSNANGQNGQAGQANRNRQPGTGNQVAGRNGQPNHNPNAPRPL